MTKEAGHSQASTQFVDKTDKFPSNLTGASINILHVIHTLSAKFAQDDVKFVENLEIPSDDPEYIDELIDKRGWALSTLFVDKTDTFPSNLTGATMNVLHVNMLPAYNFACT